MLGSLDVGAPVYYRQIQVGQVVSYNFDESGRAVDIKIFIEAPHHAKVTETTRFWNASGVDVTLDAQGLKVDTQSMVSIVSGGIAFDVPKEITPGNEAPEDTTFHLYANEGAIHEKQYLVRNYWMLLFDESVRGLSVGAPVELYGIKVGEVVDLNLEFDLDKKKFQVPVIVAIEPERISSAKKEEALKIAKNDPGALIKELVEKQGLRAQLQSGNLLTGQLMINMTFVPDAPKTTLTNYAGYRVVPTIPGSFEKLQESLTKIITNLEKVQFDQIGSELQQVLKETKTAVAEIGDFTKKMNHETSPQLQSTLIELQKTLVEVQQGMGTNSPLNYNATKSMEELSLTLRSLRKLTDTLNNQPQAIIFGKEKKADE
jgi:paraquat-inducible protein B